MSMSFKEVRYATRTIKEDGFRANRHYEYCRKLKLPYILINVEGLYGSMEVDLTAIDKNMIEDVKNIVKEVFKGMNKSFLPSDISPTDFFEQLNKDIYYFKCLSVEAGKEFAEVLYIEYVQAIKKIKRSK